MDEKSEIERHFINPEMLQQFIDQLKKDFYFSESIQSLEPDQLKPHLVFDLIYKEVNHLMNKQYGALQNALYKIDISEKQLKDEFKKNPSEDAAAVLTTMIMKRELQKIVFRTIYKNKTNED